LLSFFAILSFSFWTMFGIPLGGVVHLLAELVVVILREARPLGDDVDHLGPGARLLDHVVHADRGLARLGAVLRLGEHLGVTRHVLRALVGHVVVERLQQVALVGLADELLEQAAELGLLVVVVLGPQVFAGGLGGGAGLAERAVRELVVVDELRKRFVHLGVARGRLGLVQQVFDVVVLLLYERLRIFSDGAARHADRERREDRRDGEDMAEAHVGGGLGASTCLLVQSDASAALGVVLGLGLS
jgi:hypothetical protein